MAFDRYPAVDENLEFPPDVNRANMPLVLTTAQRDEITAARKWDGRQIYNSTVKRYERWDAASGLWSTVAELSVSTQPVALAAAAAIGSSNFAARADHAHTTPDWQSYNVTMLNGWAPGAGTLTGRYVDLGKLVIFRAAVVLGAGFSAPAQGLGISLPPRNVANVGASHKINTVTAWFTDSGSNNYMGFPLLNASSVNIYVLGSNGAATNPSATAPFPWAVGDIVEVSGIYEPV